VTELTPDEIETMRQEARQAVAHPLGAACGYAALAAKWEGQAKSLQAMGEAMKRLDVLAGQASCMCAEIYQACANELKQHIAEVSDGKR